MATKYLLVFLIAVTGVCFSGCKKQEVEQQLYFSTDRIEFGYTDNSAKFYINNIGEQEITWDVSSSEEYISFDKNSGTCSKNAPSEVEINIQRDVLNQDSISASISISTSIGETEVISLFILNFPENKIRLNNGISDAAYDYIHDRLILLSDYNDSFLEVYDLAQNKFHRIDLNHNNTCLSISPDDNYAIAGVVSSTEYISYINLENLQLVSDHNINGDINDIVAAPGNIGYLFPRYDNDKIYRLNLATNDFSTFQFNQIGENITAKLHPSGSYIYAMGAYSDLIKFDIRLPEPQLVYITSTYETYGKLWISKDGLRIFSNHKKIIHINPELPGNDVMDVTDFNFPQDYVYYVEQGSLLDEYYVIPSYSSYYNNYSESDKILVFNNDFTLTKNIYLEKFYYIQSGHSGYSQADASAEYVFSSKDGSKIIIVGKSNYDYYDNWGIEILDK